MNLALRSSAWLVLGIWTGGWFLFALVVAPTAFRELPSSQAAGQLVGPVLATLHVYGLAAGLILAVLSLTLGRSLWIIGLSLLLAAICGFSEFGVTSAIDVVRPAAFGPNAEAAAATEFSRLHETSRSLFALVGAGLVALTVLQTRADA